MKPAIKAGARDLFCQEMKVKAKPAKTIVTAYPVAAFNDEGSHCSIVGCIQRLSRGVPTVGIPWSAPGKRIVAWHLHSQIVHMFPSDHLKKKHCALFSVSFFVPIDAMYICMCIYIYTYIMIIYA
jgi:hypothetical protein